MLAKKYLDSRWFFMTEVKNWQSYNEWELCIMDAVAISKSRAKFKIIWFEIKVSRWDFLQDQKWHAYLKYSHEFRFVVPEGLIKKEELPDNIGLMYAKEDWTFKVVKRAKHEEKQIPADFFKYIIFSRIDSQYPKEVPNKQFLQDYIDGKIQSKELGRKLWGKMWKELANMSIELEALKTKKDINDSRRDTLKQTIWDLSQQWYFNARWYYWGDLAAETFSKTLECLRQMRIQIDSWWVKIADVNNLKELERYLNLSHKMVEWMVKKQEEEN